MKFILSIAFVLYSVAAFAHEEHRPELDSWYDGLMGNNGISCCHVNDCHPTHMEYRKTDLYARLGIPDGQGGWELQEFVKVPPEKILRKQINKAGQAVICHSLVYNMDHTLNLLATTVYCMLPESES